jgi:tRNA U34 5-methylaminomethyl-2-thiouridine-forming methyltransferase MnmC
MWTEAVMKKLYDALLPGGILVSYASTGSFQRALKAAGFQIEKLAGPPGKREMIRAMKSS